MSRTTTSRRTALVALALASTPTAVPAQEAARAHWGVTGTAVTDFHVHADSAVAHTGRASIRIAAGHTPGGFATIVTSVPAAPFTGRRVRLTALVRTAALSAPGAALWLRADGASTGAAFATTQGTRVIAGTTDWTEVAIELDVPPDARTLVAGALSMSEGEVWVDDVHLAPVGDVAGVRVLGFEPTDSLAATPRPARLAASPREAARPLDGRALDNVVAFVRLAGYVRFFHPGDEALATNWDEFTVRGIRAVERAPTPDSLAATLRALFAPVAPTIAVAPSGGLAARVPSQPADARGIVFWQHHGYGAPPAPGASPTASAIYRSMRRQVPLAGAQVPDTIPVLHGGRTLMVRTPSPARPFDADLGAGVSASVPLALYTSAEEIDAVARPVAATEALTANDRATRMAIAALLWMVPQHFYPYFDVVEVDWAGALRAALAAAATDTTQADFDATLDRLVAALRDGHGSVRRAGMQQASPDVRLGWIEGRVVVTAVGDAAAAAGVRLGDEVLAIDGQAVSDALRDAEARTSGSTPQSIRHVALARMVAGEPRSTVALRLRDARGGTPRELTIERASAAPPPERRPDPIAELRPGIYYVDLDRVTDAEVDAALPRLAAARGIVFDMRGYPRQVNTPRLLARLADTVIHSARFQVPLVTAPDGAGMIYAGEGWALQPASPHLSAKVAFLSGGGAISYAESTLGVVEENALGAIVGEPSAGTNGNINPIRLPAGYTFIWTGMRVTKRDGTPHHGVGILPTVPVSPTIADVVAGRDPVLERALELLDAGDAP